MQKYVCVQYHTRKSLNFDLTHLKPKIKHTNLVSISKTEKYTLECVLAFPLPEGCLPLSRLNFCMNISSFLSSLG